MASETSEWTPQLVEDLLFRQFMKGEDVSSMLPPTPHRVDQTVVFDDTIKAVFKYTQTAPVQSNGPLQQKVNAGTPHKGASMQPPTPRTPLGAKKQQTAGGQSKTPKADDKTRATDREEMPMPSAKKNRRERAPWPAHAPLDSQLKSQSRSAVQPLTEKRVRAQETVDPDLIFQQNEGDFPLQTIFAAYPDALRKIRGMRGLSGDWRTDTFTAAEEAAYKKDMGFALQGPSQAAPAGLF